MNADTMKNKTLLFDLDGTLYYVGNKMEKLCDARVKEYLVNNLDISETKAIDLIKEFRENYHYDSEAISDNYPFSQSDFIEYVCDVPTDCIAQDKELDRILHQIHNPKYIFTDSTQKHVRDVLKKEQVKIDNFIYIYDAHDMEYVFKYRKECFEKFLSKFGLSAEECVIFEDNTKNLETAKSCGIITVFIKPNQNEKPDFVDYMFSDIKTALSQIFL